MLASHGFGALWYILSIQREDSCWRKACRQNGHDPASLYCGSNVFGNNTFLQNACPTNGTDDIDPIFGIFLPALQNVSQSTNFFEKLFYCFWWGLQNLSSLGQNMKTSTDTSENLFAVFVSISGLVLFALLIGNVQTYLQSASVRIEEMRVKRRDTEQWMAHRLLPENLKERIMRHEQYRWQETRGVDEEGLLTNLPKDLRREIKRHLCLSLLMKVPMFREGDPVNEMLFIMRGTLESMTTNGGQTGFFNSNVLKGGDFCGEELLTWALDPTSASNLPGSTRTVKTLSEVETFALRADDLKFVATQFRRLHSKQLQHTFRFYSQQWRTWAACFIQAGWHRYCRKKLEDTLYEKEKRLQAAIVPIVSDGSSSLSLGAALYHSMPHVLLAT
uniref:Cyclic nucleotide-binding domain-containing protein n=1 Tax=Arundo donax TaxID=35708 RepID=A0A0A9D9N2_ARUDO